MTEKINSVLKDVLEEIKPDKEEIKVAEKILSEFIRKFDINAKKVRKNVKAFVGGSFAKGTVIKKDEYDADVFVRFDEKTEEKEISKHTQKILDKFVKDYKVVHGSRDYFKIRAGPKFFIEVIPVLSFKNPKNAKNITDLSYSHVNYVRKKTTKKTLDEIRLAKAFCYANKCYGAESYINGLSGYAIELLIIYYKSFLKFLKEFSRSKGEKIIIDIEKDYKNKNIIMMDINASKLQSPVILIDPTFKQRNAAAALSEETFERIKNAAKKFIENPSKKSFEMEKTDLEKVKNNAKKNKNEFILLEAITEKQEGDVAGSKLMKFYKHLVEEMSRFFYVREKGFNYNGEKSARYFFVVKSKREILVEGPMKEQKQNVTKFKKAHKKTTIKNGRLVAKEKVNFTLREFISRWKRKNTKRMREMSVEGLKII
jgi:tRNA nucleotidyltransferase (CCA-adding enzyme)